MASRANKVAPSSPPPKVPSPASPPPAYIPSPVYNAVPTPPTTRAAAPNSPGPLRADASAAPLKSALRPASDANPLSRAASKRVGFDGQGGGGELTSNAQIRQKLKLQFAKYDINHDGRMDATEFTNAFRACAILNPDLARIPAPVAAAHFTENAGRDGLDINGYIKIIDNLHVEAQRIARVQGGANAAPQFPIIGSSAVVAAGVGASGAVGGGGQPLNRRQSTVKAVKTAAAGVGDWFGVGNQATTDAWREAHRASMMRGQQQQQQAGQLGPRQGRLSKAYGGRANNLGAMQQGDDDDSSDDDDMPKPPPNVRMIAQFDQALAHYRAVVSKEKAEHKRKVQAAWQSNAPPSPATKALNGYRKVVPPRKKKELQRHLSRIPEFSSWFITIISVVQVAIFVVMFALSYKAQKLAPFGLGSSITTCSSDCPDTFLSEATLDTTAQHLVVANPFYGPKILTLLNYGAMFDPCMRLDLTVYGAASATRIQECGALASNPCEVSNDLGYSCCTLQNFRSGMTNMSYCLSVSGNWSQPNSLCPDTALIVLRPCCTGFTGSCSLLTEQQCTYRAGTYYANQQLCSQVNCLSPSCQMVTGAGLASDPKLLNVPINPNQFWRVFTSLFVHAGLIQAIVFIGVQYYIGADIENQAGTIRVMLIYIGSAVGGNLVSGIFSPYQVTAGCDPALFGLIAVTLVDLIQSWQIAIRPRRRLIKILILTMIALMIGTLPFVDNFSHIGGFLFGIPLSIIFLPYITFGKWDSHRKCCLLIFSIPILILMFVVCFSTFFFVQNPNFCSFCHYIDCIPYTSSLPCTLNTQSLAT